MTLQQQVQWMLENGYMVVVKGNYKVTAKFNKEMKGQELGIVKLGNKLLVQESLSPLWKTELALTTSTQTAIDWTQAYLNFIKEAEVPTRGEGKGTSYDLNKYSDPAMKAFRKMIEKEGVNYQLLVKSTMLYYKTRKQFPLTITRYIEEGAWRTDYEALLQSMQDGNVVDHIQKEIDETTEFNRFKNG